MLLGLELDAYVCIGRLPNCKEFEKRHVWVLTREADGSVTHWETSTGDAIVMPQRWKGPRTVEDVVSKDRGLTAAGAVAKLKATTAVASGAVTGALGGVAGTLGSAAQLAATVAKRGANVVQAAVLDEEDDGAAAGASGAKEGEGEEVVRRARRAKKVATVDDMLLDSEAEMRERFNDDELLNRTDIEESIAEVTHGVSLIDWTAGEPQRRERRASRGDDYDSDHEAVASSSLLPELPPVPLPYASLEAIFNHKNLWVSRLSLDPALVEYNLDDPAAWDGFVEPRLQSMDLPKSFYDPKRLSSKPPADRLKTTEQQIRGELTHQIKMGRTGMTRTEINKSAELEDVLVRGLELHERVRVGDGESSAAAQKELDSWPRDVKSKLPPGSTFKGRVVNYSYTDAKRIRKHLLSSCDYATKQDDGLQFALAVKVFGFHGGICSVWVYFGCIDTDLLS